MKARQPRMLLFYRSALVFYPRRLRLAHQEQMMLALAEAYRDRASTPPRFWLHAFADLFESSVTEHLFMLREHTLQKPVAFYTATLAVILTILGGAAAITMQQMLRGGANQPQIDMAEWYASEIGSGEAPGNVIPPGYVDMERSLQPFVIFYDDHGKPGPGTGYIDQAIPTPPAGVFDFVRSHGSENVTWQPRPGVRMASVVKRVGGKGSGFILAGRSLRVVEEQEGLLRRMAFGGWIAVMLLLIGGAALLNRAQRNRQVAA
ncbi:MAG TPA: hypothetical protein VFB79_13300 [Candidatus Angelobacter sp.]|nr:hypothetical protein [Candidatus Angelobacter sp.]